VSRNGWARSRQGHALDLSLLGYKSGDDAYAVIETRSIHSIAMIDSNGRAFSIQAADIPGGKGDGVPLTSLIDLAPGARFAHVVDAQPGKRYLVANSGGYGFVVKAEELLTRVRSGKTFMTLQPGEEVLRPRRCRPTPRWRSRFRSTAACCCSRSASSKSWGADAALP
jgi:topoisomerase-4 subunit A